MCLPHLLSPLCRWSNPQIAKLLRYGHDYVSDPERYYDALDGKLWKESRTAFGKHITFMPCKVHGSNAHVGPKCADGVHDLLFSGVTDGVDFNNGQHSRANSHIPGNLVNFKSPT